MSDRRKKSVEMLGQIGLEFHFITDENLSEYIEEPLHEAYQYLSLCHKADYLRCYFMHFFGGAYADVKPPTGIWSESLEELNSSDKWLSGFIHHTIRRQSLHIALPEEFGHQIGDQGFIFKPNTPFTREWYETIIKLMDEKTDKLKKTSGEIDKYGNDTDYPFRIGELLLEVLYPITKKYREKILINLAPLNCDIYL